MSNKTPDQLIAESILSCFDEMIMNMSPEDQLQAKIEFDSIINTSILKKISGFDDTKSENVSSE
jgi:hypothetical protein